VVNSSNGTHLTNARVTVEGTMLETFTDWAGRYRLEAPAGSVRIRAFYTGLSTQNAIVAVQRSDGNAGFRFGISFRGDVDSGETVKLDPFMVVASPRNRCGGHRDQ
jgi:hypothetical protein